MSNKTCFVISPIGEVGSFTRKRADQIFKYVIQEVLSAEEWLIERADLIAEPGIITNQIIDRLVGADLVVADLSERNPNVFYELAIRHVTKKAYVHLIAHDEDIPFDNAPVRAIKIDINDLDSVHAAKQELKAQISFALTPGTELDSPVNLALSISDLRRAGDRQGLVFDSIMNEIGDLRRMVSKLATETATDRVRDAAALAAAGYSSHSQRGLFGGGSRNALNPFDIEPTNALAMSASSDLLSKAILDQLKIAEASRASKKPSDGGKKA